MIAQELVEQLHSVAAHEERAICGMSCDVLCRQDDDQHRQKATLLRLAADRIERAMMVEHDEGCGYECTCSYVMQMHLNGPARPRGRRRMV